MKVRLGDIRRVTKEEQEYAQSLNELFGKKQDFGGTLDRIVQKLLNINKEVKDAHKLAPSAGAKTVMTGIYIDLSNKIAEIREYVEQLKSSTN